jgi:hypothetical protein
MNSAGFQQGQRVRHRTKGLTGTVVSENHDTTQIAAPPITYTVQWDSGGLPEPLNRPDEMEAIEDQTTMADPAGGKWGELPEGRRYTSEGPKNPYPVDGKD